MFDRHSLSGVDFNWQRALSLGFASHLAYQSPTGVYRVAVNEWGFDDCVALQADGVYGFCAWDPNSVLVVFRGAASVAHWLGTLQLNYETLLWHGPVHRQVLLDYRRIKPQLTSAFRRARCVEKRLWLTGHGSGGALALMITALINVPPLQKARLKANVYTFGQTKVFARISQRLGDNLSQRSLRFVAEDDVVASMPPAYGHFGPAMVFDSYDQARRVEGSAIEAQNDVIGPHSALDLQAIQKIVGEASAAFDGGQLLAPVESVAGRQQLCELDGTVMALVPGLDSHRMRAYMARLLRCARHCAHVDLAVLERIGALSEGGVPARQQRAPIVLRTRSTDWQPVAGFEVESRLGVVLSGFASRAQLDALATDAGVLSIELSREGGAAEVASSLPFVGAIEVHRPPISELGDAAVVGVIDSGFDVLHEAFLDGAGQTRIRYLWNQRDLTGPSPNEVHPGFSARNGTLYVGADIQQMVQALSAPRPLRDPRGHGTHVASIAGGRQAGSFAGGLAPAANLVLVISNVETCPPDPPSLGYSSSHQQALHFIGQAAEQLGLPLVVNISQGMNAGSHDGSTTLEAAIDQFLNLGRKPGLVVVKSAGNERGLRGHARVKVAHGCVSTIAWTSVATSPELPPRSADYIEVWYSGFDDLVFFLKDSSSPSSATAAVSMDNRNLSAVLGGNRCHLQLSPYHNDNSDHRLCIIVSQIGNAPIQPGTWTLEMFGRNIATDGVVHAWVERDDHRAVRFETGEDDEVTVSIPGTAHHVVTVAACETRVPISLVASSSWGPTRDNRSKPDLCAPGFEIAAAHAGTEAPHHAVMAMTGTSMAAPHVAGVVALALSKRHKLGGAQLNARQVQMMLVKSAKNFTSRHHPGVGFGTLDALAFLKEV
jgi:subtilisin family serine protease